MKQAGSTNDYSILRKVQMLHTQTHQRDSTFTLGRTTSYESSQFCKSFDIMSFRRASTKEDINVQNKGDEKTSLINIQSINPSTYVELEPLQQKVWKTLLKQQISCVYQIDIIVLNNQSEYEFKFNISQLSCFLRIKELTIILVKHYSEKCSAILNQPYLSILIGRVKTQKLDTNILLFELVNILINGQRTLILQESQF